MEKIYELTYIIRPDLDDSAKKTLVDRFDAILKDNGASIIDSNDWEKRKFAYQIGKYVEGTYHIINFKASDDKGINEFDRLAKISEDILRHMFVLRDPESEEKTAKASKAKTIKKPEAKSSDDAEVVESKD